MTRELARKEKKEMERIEETEKEDGVSSKNPEDIQENVELKQIVEEAEGMKERYTQWVVRQVWSCLFQCYFFE